MTRYFIVNEDGTRLCDVSAVPAFAVNRFIRDYPHLRVEPYKEP